MTNGWTDIRNADVVLAMGGNPAENHPVGFRFVMEAKRNRNAKLVCVDPRFNRTAAVADAFVQIRAGTDIAFLGGLIHYALAEQALPRRVRPPVHQRDVPGEGHLRVRRDARRLLGLGRGSARPTPTSRAGPTSWTSAASRRVDPTLQHPRSVFQVMKKFYARYTPEMVVEHLRLHAPRSS